MYKCFSCSNLESLEKRLNEYSEEGYHVLEIFQMPTESRSQITFAVVMFQDKSSDKTGGASYTTDK